jgi:hypothetical protein
LPVSGGIRVTCSQDRGALLVLHHPADHAHLERCPEIREYVLRNYRIWYEHAATSRRLGLEMGELVFVTEWYKTAKWDTFTFTSKSHDVQLSLQGSASAAANLSAGVTVSSGTYSDVHQLYGPAVRTSMPPRGRLFSSLYVAGPTAGGTAVYADSDANVSENISAGDRELRDVNGRSLESSPSELGGSLTVNQCLFI